jgi:hypothetical protein
MNEFLRTLWTKNIEEHYVGMETRVFNLIALRAEERYEWMLKHQPRFNTNVPALPNQYFEQAKSRFANSQSAIM